MSDNMTIIEQNSEINRKRPHDEEIIESSKRGRCDTVNGEPNRDSFIKQKKEEALQDYEENTPEKEEFGEKCEKLLNLMYDSVSKKDYKTVLFYGQVQGKKTMWKMFYIQLYCLLNKGIKYVFHMTQNSRDNSKQDYERMSKGLSSSEYHHVPEFDFQTKFTDEDKITIVYSIQNNSAVKKLKKFFFDKESNFKFQLEPDQCLFVMDESDTSIKNSNTEFDKELVKFYDNFSHNVRFTATPIKEVYEKNIDNTFVIPKSPNYRGFYESETETIECIDLIDYCVNEKKNLFIERITDQTKKKLVGKVKRGNTYIVCERLQNFMRVYYNNHDEMKHFDEMKRLKKLDFEKDKKLFQLKILYTDKTLQDLLITIATKLSKKVIFISKNKNLVNQPEGFGKIPILTKKNIEVILDEIKRRRKVKHYCGIIINIERLIDNHFKILQEIQDSDSFTSQSKTLLTCYNKNIFSISKSEIETEQIKNLKEKIKVSENENYLEIDTGKTTTIPDILHAIKEVFPDYCFILCGCDKLSRGISFCSKKVENDEKPLCVKTLFLFSKKTYDIAYQSFRNFGECRPDILPKIYSTKKFVDEFSKRKISIDDHLNSNRSTKLQYHEEILAFTNPDSEKIIRSSQNTIIVTENEIREASSRNRRQIIGCHGTETVSITRNQVDNWVISFEDNRVELSLTSSDFKKKFGDVVGPIEIQSVKDRYLKHHEDADYIWIFRKKNKFQKIDPPLEESNVTTLTESRETIHLPIPPSKNKNEDKKTYILGEIKTMYNNQNCNIAWTTSRRSQLNNLNNRLTKDCTKPIYIVDPCKQKTDHFVVIKYKDDWKFLLDCVDNKIFKCHVLNGDQEEEVQYWEKI